MTERTKFMRVTEIYVKERKATAITSMAGVGDDIYLGLTGGNHALAKYNTKTESIELCTEVFPWANCTNHCTKIHNALGVLDDNSLILGEGNHFTWDGLPVYNGYLSYELPEYMLERKRAQGFEDLKYSDFCLKDISTWDRERDDPGGKIVRYFPESDSIEVVASLPKYLYVQSLKTDPVRRLAYGNTIPDNHFFAVDIDKKTIKDFGRISEYAFHNLVIAPNGICYGGYIDISGRSLKLLRFDYNKQSLCYTEKTILKEIGGKIAGNQGIDQWLVTKSGRVFVGMVAGSQLYEFDYKNEEFHFIANCSDSGRTPVLEEDENGIIYIGAGYPNMHIVRFDPSTGDITDCGVVNDNLSRCYFHASLYHNKKLYLGETDGFSPSLHIVDTDTL